jgi:S1-C subfamily serine protease
LTHHHVIADADVIDVALADRRKFKSKLIDSDPKTDIALRKIESKDLSKPIISGQIQSVHVVVYCF